MVGNLVILGDSYSTFEGYVPADSQIWYGNTPKPETDVCHVEETWWHQFVNETGATLVRNQSASGSAIAYSGRGGYLPNYSYIGRFEQLINSGFLKETKVDTLIVFGGTNDSWSNAPLGEFKLGNIEEQELYCVLPAISRMAERLHDELPNAKVYFIGNCDIKSEITDAMKNACAHYGHTYIALSGIDKVNGHPTELGMAQIKDQIKAVID